MVMLWYGLNNMRKITESAVRAFLDGRKYSNNNTSVEIENRPTGAVVYLLLHHNLIAKREDGKLFITSAGWETSTTKERLNGIPGVNISQKNFAWYLNGEKWINPGTWTEVK